MPALAPDRVGGPSVHDRGLFGRRSRPYLIGTPRPTALRRTRMTRRTPSALAFVAVLAAAASAQPAPPDVTTPKQFFGFDMGADYCLANYQQLKAYWEKLAAESDRIKLVTIGTTAEGRPQLAAIVTSPANHRELATLKATSRRLALAEGVGMVEKYKEVATYG